MLQSSTEIHGLSFLDSNSILDSLPTYKDYVSDLAEGSTPADFTADYLHEAGIKPILVHDISRTYRAKDGSKSSCRAVEIILNKTNFSKSISVDVDDTTDDYSAKKQAMHQEWIKILNLKKYGINEKTALTLLKKINTQARILPSSGTHPEQYLPILELASVAYLSTRLTDQNFLKRLKENIEEESFDSWVRDELIKPVTTGPASTLPHGSLFAVEELKDGKNKEYLQINPGMEKYLVTPKKSDELRDMQLFFNSDEQKTCMRSLMNSMENNLFESKIIENMVLPSETNAEYILASFGETRFQLMKIVKILKSMQKAGLRLPDRIILFSEGRN